MNGKKEYTEEIINQEYHSDSVGGQRLSVLTEIAWQLKRIADNIDALQEKKEK